MPTRVGFEPNAQVLTCLMNACIVNGALPRAWDVFGWIRGSAEGADAKACGVLLNGCIRAGSMDQALELVEELRCRAPQVAHGTPAHGAVSV